MKLRGGIESLATKKIKGGDIKLSRKMGVEVTIFQKFSPAAGISDHIIILYLFYNNSFALYKTEITQKYTYFH